MALRSSSAWRGAGAEHVEHEVRVLCRPVRFRASEQASCPTGRVVGRPHELLERLVEIPKPARMVYEAGPTGYGLARRVS